MIKPEAALLNILILQEYYNKYRNFITIKEEKELQTLYSLLDKAMETYQRDLSYEEFTYYVLSNITYDKDVIEALLGIIQKTDIQPDLAETLLVQYKERSLAHTIALTAIDVTEGKKPFSDLADKLVDAAVPQVVEEDEFVSTDLSELYENQVKKHGLRWRLKTLNRMFGSLRKGDFGFLFARPETGKTTFLASETTYFAEQLTDEMGPILWFNNEEDGKKVQLRIFQASLGVSLQDLFKDVKSSNELYHKLTKNKIKVIDSANISKQQVESLCKKLNPSCIIFDQLDKVKGFPSDTRDDLRLGIIYQWARELAKTYCPVIAVCQADGSAEGKKWLTMENVANAKTSKQAEADWILGIGATHQDGFEFIRHLHASKNKLTGDEDSDPKMRHGKADCIIQPEIARYSDYD